MYFDLPLEELQTYRPPRNEPADFDAFWQETLGEARRFALGATFTPVEALLRTVEAFDVTFRGAGGSPIKGWLILPRERSAPLPCVVEYIGYGGGRGFPHDWLLYSAAGYAHLVMDTRGQGSVWLHGDTPDPDPEPANPQTPGFMTRGILNPRTYYYRRLITDAVRAVETARSHPAIDPARVAVAGGSQGGGLALAVSGLVSDLTAGIFGVPFLCHFRRAVEITDALPYFEIQRYLHAHRDQMELVFNNLAYFDGLNFATRAKCPALFSVGLMDEICPPSTIFAAHNYYAGEKEIRVWPYDHHEGGESFQDREKLRFFDQWLWKA